MDLGAAKGSCVHVDRQFAETGVGRHAGNLGRIEGKIAATRPDLMAISQMLAALNNTSVSALSIVARVSRSSLHGSASVRSGGVEARYEKFLCSFRCSREFFRCSAEIFRCSIE
jgi:hypothetical protein